MAFEGVSRSGFSPIDAISRIVAVARRPPRTVGHQIAATRFSATFHEIPAKRRPKAQEALVKAHAMMEARMLGKRMPATPAA
jgi:hypothetical protein